MKIVGDLITLEAPDPELERMLDSQHQRLEGLAWRIRSPRGGLGDMVKKVAEPIARALGINSCGSCEERRRWLNERFPLR